jgi:hypothetical protein
MGWRQNDDGTWVRVKLKKGDDNRVLGGIPRSVVQKTGDAIDAFRRWWLEMTPLQRAQELERKEANDDNRVP